MKYTPATLNKLERILEDSGYVVRNERGTFQSGYCILEERKVIVLNKFLQLEGRINTLMDLIPQLDINPEQFAPDIKKMYEEIVLQFRAGKEQENSSVEQELFKEP